MDKVEHTWTPRGHSDGVVGHSSSRGPNRPVRGAASQVNRPKRASGTEASPRDCPSIPDRTRLVEPPVVHLSPGPSVHVRSIPTAAAGDDSAERARRFWEGEYTPLPQGADPSAVAMRKASRDTSHAAAAAGRDTSSSGSR